MQLASEDCPEGQACLQSLLGRRRQTLSIHVIILKASSHVHQVQKLARPLSGRRVRRCVDDTEPGVQNAMHPPAQLLHCHTVVEQLTETEQRTVKREA